MPDAPSQLGRVTAIPASPDEAQLDCVPNPHPDLLYIARLTAPEFTSICPVTGQPDFGLIVLDYAPAGALIESKSFKLFLMSFRNHGAFHEDCTLHIAKRVIAAAAPKWLRIAGFWNPRGGIPIDVFWQTGPQPGDIFLQPYDVGLYKGRG